MNNTNDITSRFTLDEAVLLGKDNKDTIKINGFLVYYFKGYEDELEDILIDAVWEKQIFDPDVVQKDIISYLGSD